MNILLSVSDSVASSSPMQWLCVDPCQSLWWTGHFLLSLVMLPMGESFCFLVCMQIMVLEHVKIYHPCFYCANAPRPIHYCLVSLMHAWSANLSIKMNAANCLQLPSYRGFYKTTSFYCFLLRNLFFHAFFLLPILRSPHWLQQLRSSSACLLEFLLQIHLHVDYIYIEVLFEECHIREKSCLHKSQG